MKTIGRSATALRWLTGIGVWVLASACGSGGPSAVREVAAPKLQCPRSELRVHLNRTTPQVREYVAACDFMYTRVLCSGNACRSAPVKPPCLDGMSCFTEDPVTLEWTLNGSPERVAN